MAVLKLVQKPESQKVSFSALIAENKILREENEKLREETLRCPLTGLRNKKFLYDLAERRCQEPTEEMFILFGDIDRFKRINDRYGHDTGDKAIIYVAEHLRQSIRQEDIAVRVSGDEFVLIIKGSHLVAGQVRNRVLAELDQKVVDFDGKKVEIRFSLSEAMSFQNKEDITMADLAMYKEKNSRKTILDKARKMIGLR